MKPAMPLQSFLVQSTTRLTRLLHDTRPPLKISRCIPLLGTLLFCAITNLGCRPSEKNGLSESYPSDSDAADLIKPAEETPNVVPLAYELEPAALLEMRLPAEKTEQGWIRLFDGQSLFGWDMAGLANWSIQEGNLIVDSGEKSLLCTAVPWKDFEFQASFKADASTNSGIFFRTPLFPMDPKTECYELNIAPADNPFPTGSLVGREKIELENFDSTIWHTYKVKVEGDSVTVSLDDCELYNYIDPNPLPSNRIALQHNSGAVAFKDIMLRPLGLSAMLPENAQPGTELTAWKRYPDMQGSFDFDSDGNLHVQGGKGQLESETQYGDFVLLTRAKTAGPNQNSGIFFRCIPYEEMNGYECQINNDAKDGNPAFPADCGTGGIFRRQDARIIAAENGEWFDMVLVTSGPSMAAWVNGIQVSQWQDTRDPDPNPRRGLRTEPGTIMLQAHDETTDVTFKAISVAPLTN